MTNNKNLMWMLATALLACLVYLPTLSFDLVWDDLVLVSQPSWYEGAIAWTRPMIYSAGYWRPLVSMTIGKLGHNAFAQHALNILLFGGLAAGLYSCAARVLPEAMKEKAKVAALIALPLALHPGLSEAVSWVSGRFDLTMTLCIAWALSLSFVGTRKAALGVAVLSFAALLSKDPAPLALLGIALVALPKIDKAARFRVGGALFSAMAAWVSLRYILGIKEATTFTYLIKCVRAHPLEASAHIAQSAYDYAGVVFAPWLFVSPVHEFEITNSAATLTGWLAFFAFAMLAVGALRHFKSDAARAFGMASAQLFPAMLLMAPQANVLIAGDRYISVCMPFLAVGIAFLISKKEGLFARISKRPALLGCGLLVCALGAGSINAALMWRDNEILTRVAKTQPGSVMANLGAALHLIDKRSYAQAEPYVDAALAHSTEDAVPTDMLATLITEKTFILAKTGKDTEALTMAAIARLGHMSSYKVEAAEALVRFRNKDCWKNAGERSFSAYMRMVGGSKNPDVVEMTAEIQALREKSGCAMRAETKDVGRVKP